MSSNRVLVSSLSALLPESTGVFICSGSFEERSRIIPGRLEPSRADCALVCSDDAFAAKASHDLLAHFGDRGRKVTVKINDPLFTADSLQKAFRELPRKTATNYVVDITTFTHEILLILLRVLQMRLRAQDTVTGVYNSAAEYSVGTPSEQKWLSKGIGEVRSVLGYPGRIVPTKKLHLLILAGFEPERAQKLIEAYEPSLLSIGYGDPLQSISDAHFGLNKSFQSRLVDKYKEVLQFTFSCSDPLATKSSVEKHLGASLDHNVLIAPLNTKISSVGVALAAIHNDAIQLCYAPAAQYNVENYSVPSEDCYIFEIPLPGYVAPDTA